MTSKKQARPSIPDVLGSVYTPTYNEWEKKNT